MSPVELIKQLHASGFATSTFFVLGGRVGESVHLRSRCLIQMLVSVSTKACQKNPDFQYVFVCQSLVFPPSQTPNSAKQQPEGLPTKDPSTQDSRHDPGRASRD